MRHEGYWAAERLIADLRSTNPDLVRMPRPIVEIAREFGVEYDPLRPGLGIHFSGLLDGNKIYVSDNDSVHRVRYTIAHELAHYLLGSTLHNGLSFRGLHTTEHQDVEAEADGFASGLLLDQPRLRDLLAGMIPDLCGLSVEGWADMECEHRVISRITTTCNVSYPMVLQALADAGLVEGIMPWGDCPGVAFSRYRKARAARTSGKAG